MRRYRPLIVLFAFSVLSAGNFFAAPRAYAAFNATDGLGQISGGSMVFTTSNPDNGATTNGQGLDYPYGLALDALNHRLFVSDSNNHRVLVFPLDSNNNLSSHTASYVLGQMDFSANSANQGGTASSTTMHDPEDLAYDSANSRLFVTDVENNRVLVFNLASGISNDMAASYVLGQADFFANSTNQGGTASSTTMNFPNGLAYDSASSRLFVTDGENNRVLVFNLASGIRNDMAASYVLGQTDFFANSTNQGGTASSTTMSFPYAIAYDSSASRLFVDDDTNNRALVFDLSGSITNDMAASYVLGQPDMTTVNKSTTSAKESMGYVAEELAYDATRKRLFVGDDGSNRILVFDLSQGITNYMAASAVFGQTDFTSTSNDTTQSGINDPELGMAYDPSHNRLWMTDDSNNRVLAWDFVTITTSSLPSGTLSTSYSQTLAASQSQGTLSWGVTAGSLPPGLSLGAESGIISGTPTTAGTYNFTVTATDTISSVQTFADSASLSISVAAAPATSGGGSISPIAGVLLIPNPLPGATARATETATDNLTSGQIEAILSLLASFGADQAVIANVRAALAGGAGSSTPGATTFTRDLRLGATGADVRALEQYLNAHAAPLAKTGPGSPGHETAYFGPLTKAALARFQVAHGITPAAGYFGPKTRAYLSAHP